MLKHVDLVASNVPGFDQPVYVAGARLQRFIPFGPTLGAAANVVLMSYLDHCDIGLTTDMGAVEDPEVLRECLVESFDELVRLETAAPGARRTSRNRPRRRPG
jgi:diacylglycerol O-acyltransferase